MITQADLKKYQAKYKAQLLARKISLGGIPLHLITPEMCDIGLEQGSPLCHVPESQRVRLHEGGEGVRYDLNVCSRKGAFTSNLQVIGVCIRTTQQKHSNK